MDNKERWNSFTIPEKMASIELFPEEAKQDASSFIRLAAYKILGFTEEATKDEYWYIRWRAYHALGFTEDAKKDSHWEVRIDAYRKFGFSEESKRDSYWRIRLAAYQALGFTEEAKKDEAENIRKAAEAFFKVKARPKGRKGGKYEKHEHLKSLASDRAGRNPGRKGDGK